MSDKIIHLTNGTFDGEVLKATGLVLVDFWAERCAPCRALAPILDDLAGELAGKVKITKVDVDSLANQQLAVNYGIRNIPTLLLFKNGQVVATKVGAGSKAQLKTFIEEQL